MTSPMPNPQDPGDAMYQFVDTQPDDSYPSSPDSSLSHFTTRQFTPENITSTFPVVVTLTNHGFQNGQALRATGFITIPFALATGMEQLNNSRYYVGQRTADNFQLYTSGGLPVDGRLFTTYISGGQMTLVGPDLPVVNPSEFPPAGTPQNPLP